MNVKGFNVFVKKDNTQIISNMNVDLKQGEMLSILGPSGSGKTTLLDYLTCNFSQSLRFEGDVEVRGVVKYISQEEKLHGFYTVRRYLGFYFDLNYGYSVDEKEKNCIVESIAESCGLTSCLDTIVGDIFFKGISGGQKRRLSIALEIISKPDILIVDEPTSGLDSYSAFKVMELLRDLTRWGITVVCTIHQPSSEIWNMLDKIMVLVKGHTCYLGTSNGAKEFFEFLGKPVPLNYNVSDHILTHVNNDFDPSIKPEEIAAKYLEWFKTFSSNNAHPVMVKRSWRNNTLNNDRDKINVNKNQGEANENREIGLKEKNEDEQEVKQMEEAYDPNNDIQKKVKEHDKIIDVFCNNPEGARIKLDRITTVANCVEKFLSILKRSLINLIKNPGIMIVRLVMYTMLCFMIGVLYVNLGDKIEHQDINSRIGMLFYCDAFLVFMSIAVLPFYIIDRGIVQKEVNNTLYHPFHYLTSQFLVSLLGVAFISIISTLFVILIPDLNGFGIFFVILFLSLAAAESLCRLISLLVPHYIIGMALVAGVYGMFMLTQGFLIIKKDIPGYLIWLYYIGFHTYSFEGFMYNEFNSIEKFNSEQFANGQEVLKFYSMDDTRIWMDCVILISWSIFLEILSLIVMTIKFSKKSHIKIVPEQ